MHANNVYGSSSLTASPHRGYPLPGHDHTHPQETLVHSMRGPGSTSPIYNDATARRLIRLTTPAPTRPPQLGHPSRSQHAPSTLFLPWLLPARSHHAVPTPVPVRMHPTCFPYPTCRGSCLSAYMYLCLHLSNTVRVATFWLFNLLDLDLMSSGSRTK